MPVRQLVGVSVEQLDAHWGAWGEGWGLETKGLATTAGGEEQRAENTTLGRPWETPEETPRCGPRGHGVCSTAHCP